MKRLLAIALIAFATVSVAKDYGEILPKVKSCPPGYRTSGSYCIPIKNTNETVTKIKTCPRGYRTSGSYCIKLDK